MCRKYREGLGINATYHICIKCAIINVACYTEGEVEGGVEKDVYSKEKVNQLLFQYVHVSICI